MCCYAYVWFFLGIYPSHIHPHIYVSFSLFHLPLSLHTNTHISLSLVYTHVCVLTWVQYLYASSTGSGLRILSTVHIINVSKFKIRVFHFGNPTYLSTYICTFLQSVSHNTHTHLFNCVSQYMIATFFFVYALDLVSTLSLSFLLISVIFLLSLNINNFHCFSIDFCGCFQHFYCLPFPTSLARFNKFCNSFFTTFLLQLLAWKLRNIEYLFIGTNNFYILI